MRHRWTVIWTKSAEQELCDLYNAARPRTESGVGGESSKQEVADAADEIDKSLGRDPNQAGEVRPGGDARGFDSTGRFCFEYHVDSQDRLVRVLSFQKRKRFTRD